MKQLVFIAQSKGGAGKSILSYLLAEKYQDALIVDMDDATMTTSKNLNYRKPKHVKFLNQSNTIDRGTFDEFLELVPEIPNNIIICDMGASVSEQLPYYLKDNNMILAEALEALEINLNIFCVVGGGNLFSSTMKYLADLIESVEEKIPVTVFKNEYYWFNEVQEMQYAAFLVENELSGYDFTVSKDRNEITQNRIREVLEAGKGIRNAKIFSKAYFQMAIKKLPDLVPKVSDQDRHEETVKPQKAKVKK
jgi:hypothetical protein